MTDPTRSAIEAYCQWCRSNERCPEMDELIAERDALIRERDEARRYIKKVHEALGLCMFNLYEAQDIANGLMTGGRLAVIAAESRSEKDWSEWATRMLQKGRRVVEAESLCNSLMSAGRDAVIAAEKVGEAMCVEWKDAWFKQREATGKYGAEVYANDMADKELDLALKNLDTSMTERDHWHAQCLNLTSDYRKAVADTAQAYAWHQRQNTTEFERLYARINEAEEHAERLVGQRDSFANELTAMTAERDDLRAQLDAMTKERDDLRSTICWNVECVHQAKALDVAAGMQKELDEARERAKALEGAIMRFSMGRTLSVEAYDALGELLRVARKGGE